MRRFILNSQLWGYDQVKNIFTPVRGHKFHIIPVSPLPIALAFSILLLIVFVILNLHLSVDSSNLYHFEKQFYIIYYALESLDEYRNTAFYWKLAPNSDYMHHIDTPFLESGEPNSLHVVRQINGYDAAVRIYFHWFSPFFLSLGCFFIWCSIAIEEGTTYTLLNKYIKFNNNSYLSYIGTSAAFHNNIVRKGFKIGFILFILSEIMFFFGFFWGFFHSALSPVIQIGAVWPPIGVDFIAVKGFAVANTVILLTSGLTLTIAHYAIELIPQKWTILNISNKKWSKKSYEHQREVFSEIQEDNFDSKAKILPKLKVQFIDDLIKTRFLTHLKELLYFNNPIKLYFTPFKKYFSITGSIFHTELLVKTYVGFLINLTVLLAFLFMSFQVIEYFISPVNINSGVYGSTFYMITGLHGIHVFIGTCFLIYCRTAISTNRLVGFLNSWFSLSQTRKLMFEKRFEKNIQKKLNFFWNIYKKTFPTNFSQWYYGSSGIESFECAAWYWHFVDVVWIFVYAFVYVWSHSSVLDKH